MGFILSYMVCLPRKMSDQKYFQPVTPSLLLAIAKSDYFSMTNLQGSTWKSSQYTIFFQKKSVVNFKHLYCCDCLMNIRKMPQVDFLQILKNLKAGPFFHFLAPKTQNNFFFQKFYLIQFQVFILP